LTTARLFPAALAATLALAGCTDWAGYDIDKASEAIPQLANMRRSVIPDPYAMPRSPAPGTVPVLNPMGDVPGEYSSAQLDSAAATLTNPYAQPSEAVLARGKLQYDNNCTVCHGPAGAGDGTVVKPVVVGGQSFTRFPYAPPLVSGGALTRSDGYVYAVIDVGRGLMPPYGHRITHNDRWAVVAYVRQLQRAAGATPTPQPAVPQAPNATAPAPGAGQPAGAGGTTVTTPGGIQPGDSVPTATAPAGPGTR
jgi:mono/diheme cytochrome c family protein